MNMKLVNTFALFIASVLSTQADDYNVKVKGIQVIGSGDECKKARHLQDSGKADDQVRVQGSGGEADSLQSNDGGGRGLRNMMADEKAGERCALTLFPPDNSALYLPDITYTFWKCGAGQLALEGEIGCTCGITRVVTVSASSNVALPLYQDEYISENACNASCSRGVDDKCWVCMSQSGPGEYTNYFCRHKADITPFMLGAPAKKRSRCNIDCFARLRKYAGGTSPRYDGF